MSLVTMIEIMNKAREINDRVIEMHDAHYMECPTGLIRPDQSPNGNTIYHLLSDGSIEYTKGGDVYGQRSVFSSRSAVVMDYKYLFRFPKHDGDSHYAILTESECIAMREEMDAWGRAYRNIRQTDKSLETPVRAVMDLYSPRIYEKFIDTVTKGYKTVFNTPAEITHLYNYLTYGADPDTTNDSGETVLMWAAACSSPVLFTLLNRADLTRKDREGRTFLHYLDNPSFLLRIIKHVPTEVLTAPDQYGNTPFHAAVLRRNYSLAQVYLDCLPGLVNARTIDGETVLFYAATDSSSKEFAEKLLLLGADKTITNTSGKTAKDLAVEFNNTVLIPLL